VLIGIIQLALRHPDLETQTPYASALAKNVAMSLIDGVCQFVPEMRSHLMGDFAPQKDLTAEEF
jgi:hypothetical protein